MLFFINFMFGIISGKILVTFLRMLPLFRSLWSVLLELPQGMCWTLMPLNLCFSVSLTSVALFCMNFSDQYSSIGTLYSSVDSVFTVSLEF